MALSKMNYDYSVCRGLAESAPRNDKEFKEAVKYFHERVFYTNAGLVYVYEDGVLVPHSIEKFDKNQKIGFDAKLRDAIAKQTCPYKSVLEPKDYEIDLENRKINSMRGLRASKLNVKVTEKGKQYVEFFKTYVLEVLANGDKASYDINIKWFANLIQLKKNNIALVFVSSTEGCGKSTPVEIMLKLIGEWNHCAPDAKDFVNFNWECYGKILVALEETEGLHNSASSLRNKLKNTISNKKLAYTSKNVNSQTLDCINNIYISSNFPIPDSEGRRYHNQTPSTKWLNDRDKWKKLYQLDDENMRALYEFLMSVDTSKFDGQEAVHELKANRGGNMRAVEQMISVWKYMRKHYALPKISENIKPRELYRKYKESFGDKSFSESLFREKISELNIPIETRSKNGEGKSGGYPHYIIDGEALYKVFKGRNMILAEEEIVDNDEEDELPVEIVEPKESRELKQVKKENNDLKTRIAELEKLVLSLKGVEKPEKKAMNELADIFGIERVEPKLKTEQEPVRAESWEELIAIDETKPKNGVYKLKIKPHSYSEPVDYYFDKEQKKRRLSDNTLV